MAFQEIFQLGRQFFGRRRKVLCQAKTISEAQQECLVLRAQRFLQKCFQILVMALHERLLASTHVHQQAKVQRNVSAFGEERDFLSRPVLEYFEVVLLEIHHQLAGAVAYCEPHIDQLDVDADWGLRGEGKCQEEDTC